MKLEVLIELSEGCNMNCTYCFQEKTSKHRISIRDFVFGFIDVYNKTKSTNYRLNLYGGEPLIHFEKIKQIVNCIKSIKKHDFSYIRELNIFSDDELNDLKQKLLPLKNFQYEYWMSSNLLSLNQEKADFIVNNKINVSFSYDGLNQNERPLLNGSSSNLLYDNKNQYILNFIKYLKEYNIGFKIHTVLTPFMSVKNNSNYIYEKFLVYPEFNLVKDHGVWDKESLEFLNDSLDELEQEPYNFHYYFMDGIHKLIQYQIDGITSNCGAGQKHFAILDNGNIRGCERQKNEDDVNILSYWEAEQCKTCDIRNFCKKGCPYETRKNGLVPLCTYYKKYFKICKNILNEIQNSDVETKRMFKNRMVRYIG